MQVDREYKLGLSFALSSLLFAAGTYRLSLTVMGIAQYTAPSITFLLAVFVYREPFELPQLITFLFIWLGIVIFTGEGLRYRKQTLQQRK